MDRARNVFAGLLVALTLPAVAAAQAPPDSKPPVSPRAESHTSGRCAPSDTRSTVGKGGPVDEQRDTNSSNLSDKLSQSGGVICPPEETDSEIHQPTPPAGRTPVIPPPGAPGGDPSVQPK